MEYHLENPIAVVRLVRCLYFFFCGKIYADDVQYVFRRGFGNVEVETEVCKISLCESLIEVGGLNGLIFGLTET